MTEETKTITILKTTHTAIKKNIAGTDHTIKSYLKEQFE